MKADAVGEFPNQRKRGKRGKEDRHEWLTRGSQQKKKGRSMKNYIARFEAGANVVDTAGPRMRRIRSSRGRADLRCT